MLPFSSAPIILSAESVVLKHRHAKLRTLSLGLLLLALVRYRRYARMRHYITRTSLRPHAVSAGHHLIVQRDNMAYIDTFGFGVDVFDYLHRCVAPRLMKTTRNGRPRAMSSCACLALTLQWFNTCCPLKTLATIYGITPSTVSDVLRKTKSILIDKLPFIHEARIQWPTADEMEQLSALVAQRARGTLLHVFGFVDGIRLDIETPDDPLEENAYYSGATSTHCINNVICFQSDGCICWARCNVAGAKQDNSIALPLYDLLEQKTPRPYVILGDSAFYSARMQYLVLTPLKEGEVLSTDPVIRRFELIMSSSITSQRVAAEWGNSALKRTFARLKIPLSSNAIEREKVLLIILYLFNLRTRLTGFNQIKTLYTEN